MSSVDKIDLSNPNPEEELKKLTFIKDGFDVAIGSHPDLPADKAYMAGAACACSVLYTAAEAGGKTGFYLTLARLLEESAQYLELVPSPDTITHYEIADNEY